MSPTPRPSLAKRVSKLSFGIRRDRSWDRELSVDNEREAVGRPSGATTLTMTPSSGSSSFFNVLAPVHRRPGARTRGSSPHGERRSDAASLSLDVDETYPSRPAPLRQSDPVQVNRESTPTRIASF
ncbi:hypothetical protein B0H13DRAFT_2324166 [Mycena leptocephala]|nr:hypothetical protein B0H13DRAFT_2324166 [Mycena leptocephala]